MQLRTDFGSFRIEHLPPEIFPFFALIILGFYRPLHLLITTPSYTFNSRFTAPDAPPSARDGFLDPTGRTERIFRHHDHKFEWTVEEFQAYCNEVAQKYGYDVDIGGIGKPVEDDPWGRDDELGFATQVAHFTRKYASLAPSSLMTKPLDESSKHELLVTYQYFAHPLAYKAEVSEAIQKKVIEVMSSYRVVEGWTIYELWVEDNISELCGGLLNVLFEAIESCGYLTIDRTPGDRLKWLSKLTEDAISSLNIKIEAVYENVWKEQESWPEDDVTEHKEQYEIDNENEQIWTAVDSSATDWTAGGGGWDYTDTSNVWDKEG